LPLGLARLQLAALLARRDLRVRELASERRLGGLGPLGGGVEEGLGLRGLRLQRQVRQPSCPALADRHDEPLLEGGFLGRGVLEQAVPRADLRFPLGDARRVEGQQLAVRRRQAVELDLPGVHEVGEDGVVDGLALHLDIEAGQARVRAEHGRVLGHLSVGLLAAARFPDRDGALLRGVVAARFEQRLGGVEQRVEAAVEVGHLRAGPVAAGGHLEERRLRPAQRLLDDRLGRRRRRAGPAQRRPQREERLSVRDG